MYGITSNEYDLIIIYNESLDVCCATASLTEISSN